MFFTQKLSNFDPVLNKQLQLKRVTKGAELSAADFCDFAAKKAISTPFQSYFALLKPYQ